MSDESHLGIPPDQRVEQGHAVLTDAVAAYTQALDERLIAAYALGSLAHGGFSPLVSDVDLALILTDPLRPTDSLRVATIARGLKRKGPPLHDRLSVFWGTPSSLTGRVPGGRFPPLDRLDLIDHGRLLKGEDVRSGLLTPTRDELLVAGALFALESLAGLVVRPPHQPLGQALGFRPHARGVRRLAKLVLFPVRFLFTAETGRVGTNDAAVNHYLAARNQPGAALVSAALAWRTVPPENDEAVLSLLEAGIVPLYLHYIDDQRARLSTLGYQNLVEAFGHWRRLLVQ